MKTKTKIILSSLATVVLFGSLTYATYSAFKQKEEVNIAITSGKLEVKATMKDLTLYSPTTISADGVVTNATNAATNTFANGGSAGIIGNQLNLINMTAGDKVNFNINIDDSSNIAGKYRVLFSASGEDLSLLAALKVKIGSEDLSLVKNYKSNWATLEDKVVPVEVELPSTANSFFSNKSLSLSYVVEAAQANGDFSEEGFSEKVQYVIVNPTNVQLALDNAAKGDILLLDEGDYGNLYLRQTANSIHIENTGGWAGGGDYLRYRNIEDISLIGMGDANISSFVIEADTYVPGGNSHSQEATFPYLVSYVELTNFAVENVNFNLNGKNAFSGDGKIGIDGLTIKNCNIVASDAKESVLVRQSDPQSELKIKDSTETINMAFNTNITIENCQIYGVKHVANFNGVGNLNVLNNKIYNAQGQGFMLNKNVNHTPGVFGEVNIIGNEIVGQDSERTMRVNYVEANAKITVKNNNVTQGHNEEFAKFSNVDTGAVISFEGNTWVDTSVNPSVTYNDATAKTASKIIY